VPFATIALVLLVHCWGEVERYRYETRVAALRAAGQPVALEDLEPPRGADEANAAIVFAEAEAILKQTTNPHPYLDLEVATPETCDEMRRYLGTLGPYFEKLAQVPIRPSWHVDRDWGKGLDFAIDEFRWLQDASQLLLWRVELDPADKGRAERAAEATVLLIRLGDRCRAPFVMGELLRQLTATDYPALFLRAAMRQPGFDVAAFRRVVEPRLAEAVRPSGPPRATLAQERVFSMRLVDILGSGTKTELDRHLPFKGVLQKSLLWRPFLYRDANRMLDLFEEAIALADGPPEEASRAARRLEERYGTSDPTCFVTAWTLPALARAFDAHAKGIAVDRLTRVVMALLEHRRRDGAWPESLAALGDLPGDPYSGRPFLYECTDSDARIRSSTERYQRLADGGARATAAEEWERLESNQLAWHLRDARIPSVSR
jgi:hypothetical protein